MSVCFVLDAPCWERPELRHALSVARQLLDVPGRLTAAGTEVGSHEAVVFVGDPDGAPPHAAAVIPVRSWPDWRPGELVRVDVEEATMLLPKDADHLTVERRLPEQWMRSLTFILLREEERIELHRDEWECFSGFSSIQHERGVLDRPLLHGYIDMLKVRIDRWLAATHRQVERIPRWKNNARFAAMLSHDVDWTSRYSVPAALRLLRRTRTLKSYAFRQGLAGLLESLSPGRPAPDPYWEMNRWVDEEQHHGFASTFYFVPAGGGARHEFDPTYEASDEVTYRGAKMTVGTMMKALASDGCEVGLHGSYLSHKSAAALAQQKAHVEQYLGSPISGLRQHFLRFDVDSTWAAQSEAGFAYDATLGYNEALGFRAGIGIPFRAWDSVKRTALPLLAVPLTAMDGVLFRTLKLDGVLAQRRMHEHLDTVEAAGALAGLLWHPNAIAACDFPGWWDCYRATLEDLAKRGAWVATGAQINEWWSARERAMDASAP